MAKISINKLALELGLQNDQVIEALQKNKVIVKNYMSSVDEEAAKKIRDLFAPKVPAKAKPKAVKVKTKIKLKTPKRVQIITQEDIDYQESEELRQKIIEERKKQYRLLRRNPSNVEVTVIEWKIKKLEKVLEGYFATDPKTGRQKNLGLDSRGMPTGRVEWESLHNLNQTGPPKFVCFRCFKSIKHERIISEIIIGSGISRLLCVSCEKKYEPKKSNPFNF